MLRLLRVLLMLTTSSVAFARWGRLRRRWVSRLARLAWLALSMSRWSLYRGLLRRAVWLARMLRLVLWARLTRVMVLVTIRVAILSALRRWM